MKKIIGRSEYEPPRDTRIIGIGSIALFMNKEGKYYFYRNDNGSISPVSEKEVIDWLTGNWSNITKPEQQRVRELVRLSDGFEW